MIRMHQEGETNVQSRLCTTESRIQKGLGSWEEGLGSWEDQQVSLWEEDKIKLVMYVNTSQFGSVSDDHRD